MTNQELINLAKTVRQKAYCPHSKFYVGAAILDHRNKIFTSCNVENIAYPQSSCAEAGAISAMISDGGQLIKKIAIVGGNKKNTLNCSPCGGCRQRISEFSDENTEIIIKTNPIKWEIFKIDELLPHFFKF
tara:strand:- start:98 stop:490 length:393 start_codon:yes stop_codon:yes gene_type:complete